MWLELNGFGLDKFHFQCHEVHGIHLFQYTVFNFSKHPDTNFHPHIKTITQTEQSNWMSQGNKRYEERISVEVRSVEGTKDKCGKDKCWGNKRYEERISFDITHISGY